MKGKAGIACMVLGALLVLGAALLAIYNQKDDRTANKMANELIPKLVEEIRENTREEEIETDGVESPELQKPVELLTDEDKKMTEVEVDGHLYIGCLSIEALNLELPVLSGWSYPELKIAPCRYAGSIRGEDMVIMAHNYKSHFGNLSGLEVGEEISFTDMDGKITYYRVVGKDLLPDTAVEEITAGDFALTLFTCNYSGASRIVVYCDVI